MRAGSVSFGTRGVSSETMPKGASSLSARDPNEVSSVHAGNTERDGHRRAAAAEQRHTREGSLLKALGAPRLGGLGAPFPLPRRVSGHVLCARRCTGSSGWARSVSQGVLSTPPSLRCHRRASDEKRRLPAKEDDKQAIGDAVTFAEELVRSAVSHFSRKICLIAQYRLSLLLHCFLADYFVRRDDPQRQPRGNVPATGRCAGARRSPVGAVRPRRSGAPHSLRR